MCAGATWLDAIIMFQLLLVMLLLGHNALLWLWVGRPCRVNVFGALACLPTPLLEKVCNGARGIKKIFETVNTIFLLMQTTCLCLKMD